MFRASLISVYREYLEIIKQKTDGINSMVSQLFLYSKIDMGNYPTFPEKLNIGQEISDFVVACIEEYRAKGLEIQTNNMLANKNIYADPTQLRSLFANILTNSAKNKNKETANAIIQCTANDGVVHIVFEDDGPGVQEDSLPELFNERGIQDLWWQNGAGKTTLMRMVCGLAEPTSGEIMLFGSHDLVSQRHRMGCTIENPALYPSMTAKENMET